MRRALPAVVTLATGLGALGWIAGATLVPAVQVPYLPPDGFVTQVQRLDSPIGARLLQAESAVGPALMLDSPLGRAIAEDGLPPTDTALRLTFAPEAPQDEVVLAVQGADLALRGFSLDGVGRLYSGGLPLVGGDVEGRFEVAGGDPADFTGSVTVSPSTEGCDEIGIELTTASDAVEHLAFTMCEDRGITAMRVETGAGRVGFEVTDQVVPFAETTLEVPDRDWGDAADWQPVAYVPTATDVFGQVTGVRSLWGAPAPLRNGDVALLDDVSDDVLVFRPDDDGVASLMWRGHPGGQVVAVVGVGGMVVAVRTGGSMVGYSVDGVRIWETDAPTDSVVGTVVPVTGRLTFATLDGWVWMLDASTGEVQWSHQVAEQLTSGVTADERVTFAFDTEGNLFGFSWDGQQVFDGSVPSAFTVVALDQANSYLARGAVVEAYELQYSQFQWASDIPAPVTAVCSTEDRVVVATTARTYALDPATGTPSDLTDHGDAIACGRSAVVVVAGTTVWALTSSGASPSVQMPSPVVTTGFNGIAPMPAGVWIVHQQALVRWSA